MANISFGGGSDPSGIFAGLSRQTLLEMESLARDAVRRQDAISDAADADMYDRWQNGLISDEAWLAYIAQRVAETAGKPEGQRWIEAQREHSSAIADAQAEEAYESGDATIHDLIAYYREKIGGLEENSDAFRKAQDRLFEVVDKAASDDIFFAAQDIADSIALGRASLGDLVAFYQERLGGLRTNSALADQIRREIRQLQSQIVTGGGTGGGGGGGGRRGSGSSGGGSRGGSTGSAGNDYRVATESGLIPRSDYLMHRNDMGISADAAEFGGLVVTPNGTLSLKDSIEYLKMEEERYFQMSKGIDEPSEWVYDPLTGDRWPNTPEFHAQLGLARMDSLERLAVSYGMNGQDEDAIVARGKIADTLTTIVRPAHGVSAREAVDRLYQIATPLWEAADNSGDPSATRHVAGRLAVWHKQLIRAETKIGTPLRPGQGTGGIDPEITEHISNLRDKPAWMMADADTLIGMEMAYQMWDAIRNGDLAAAETVIGPLMNDEKYNDILPRAVLRSDDKGWLVQAATNMDAEQRIKPDENGNPPRAVILRDSHQVGGWDVLPIDGVDPDGWELTDEGTFGRIPGSGRDPLVDRELTEDMLSTAQWTNPRTGRTQSVMVVRELIPVPGKYVLAATSRTNSIPGVKGTQVGDWLTQEVINSASPATIQGWINQGLVEKTAYLAEGFREIDSRTGRVTVSWYDPNAGPQGGWVDKPPIAFAMGTGGWDIDGDSVLRLNSDGAPDGLTYRPGYERRVRPTLVLGDEKAAYDDARRNGGSLGYVYVYGRDGNRVKDPETGEDMVVDATEHYRPRETNAAKSRSIPGWADPDMRVENQAARAQAHIVTPNPERTHMDDQIGRLMSAMGITTGEMATEKTRRVKETAQRAVQPTTIDRIVGESQKAAIAARRARVEQVSLPKITLPRPTQHAELSTADLPSVRPPAQTLAQTTPRPAATPSQVAPTKKKPVAKLAFRGPVVR